MYYCRECNSIFDDMIDIHEDGGCYEADYGVYDLFESHNYYPAVDYRGCPICKASESCIDEAIECNCCGEIFSIYDLHELPDASGDLEYLCDKCSENLE